MVLENGARILLISDPETDKSAAALDVHIGAMSDPEGLPGLAHFCEHMLFLGTSKYPQENALKKFLTSHSGSCNAFTTNDHTNYYFDVAPEHLLEALDIFAQFFVCPLFTESAVEREVSAVHSEYEKDVQNDIYRLYQLHRSLSRPGHDFGKFIYGNKSTLSDLPKTLGINVRDELLSFHAKYYSSNIMCICIIGKEPLDTLADWSLQLFAPIENKSVSAPVWSQHPFGPQETGVRVTAIPIADTYQMMLKWPIPDMTEHWKSKPGQFIACQFKYGGEGSLLAAVKDLGWVNGISASETADAKGFQFFSVELDLTPVGIDHADDIVTLVYQYLLLLKQSSLHEWIFEEEKNLLDVHFTFKDKELPLKYVSGIARDMHDYPAEHVLDGPSTWHDFRPDLIAVIMELLRPDNMTLIVVSKKFEGSTDQREQWYGTGYSVARIGEELISRWKTAGPSSLFFPRSKNEYIPTNFDICKRDGTDTEFPKLVKNSPLIRCWHKQDETFLLPKLYVTISFSSPHIEQTPRNVNLANLFVMMFNDSLSRHSYQAEVAGLTFGFRKQWHSLLLNVEGYSDKLPVLFEKLLRRLTNFRVDDSRFGVMRREHVQELQNFPSQSPMSQCFHYFTMCIQEGGWTKSELLNDMKAAAHDGGLLLGPASLQQFIDQLFTDVHLDMLVYGNAEESSTLELARTAERSLAASRTVTALPPLLVRRHFRLVQLPQGSCYRYRVNNDVHPNSFLMNYYQFGVEDLHSNMLLELFTQLMREHCFDVLRTQEQLGYIVSTFWMRMGGVRGLLIFLLSHKPPTYVEQRVDSFMETLKTFLADMADDEFEKHKQALVLKRLEKPKNMSEQDTLYWNEIAAETYNFDKDRVEAAHVGNITKRDVIEFYEANVRMDGQQRRKFVIYVTAVDHQQAVAQDDYYAKVPATVIEDHVAFKQGLGLFPLPTSYCKGFFPAPAVCEPCRSRETHAMQNHTAGI